LVAGSIPAEGTYKFFAMTDLAQSLRGF